MKEHEPSAQALRMAVLLLGRKSLSREELRQRLRRKGMETEAVEEALRVCMERGYLDEEERASQIVRSGLRAGHGPLRVRRDLKQRGIPELLGEKVMEALMAEGDAMLSVAARKKLGEMHQKDPAKKKAALYRFLLSRGFPSSDILHFIHHMEENPPT
ncbi:regulatory protein RecX [Desulfobotulus sp.]|uniref:regulatory protein RecX n=1 Tax=Desulfobotulus sp. TaxID=1940337 RepID=UPI002A35A25A|nr:regulatory protein RecX [Desulfobotulus sp.]MDY0161765.1 regulatory protein RecX [Desulfobotulus sp.]